jgi:hypothetical protein
MLFKGEGSFKKLFKIGGNVVDLKAFRLIPLTPPPPWSFNSTFKVAFYHLLVHFYCYTAFAS